MDPSSANVNNLRDIYDLVFEIQVDAEQSKTYYFVDVSNFSGIPVASMIAYERFRERLRDDLQIPLDATLYPPRDSGVVNIENKSSCIIAITQVQGSDSINIPESTRPILRLTPNLVAIPSTPQGSKTMPTRPTTPPNPSTQKRLLAGPKTADSPGGKEDESKDTQEESDGEYDDGTGNENDVIRHFRYDWSRVDYGTWVKVCSFFSCELDATKIRIEGIKVDIEPYQAFAIYRILTQVTTFRSSFILGDDVGLGKTGITLCAATIFFMLHKRYRETLNEWDDPPTTGAKHRAYGASPDEVCPTQMKEGLQCPCVVNSLAEEIVTSILSFPTLIIAPPGLIPTFVGEADKWVDLSPGSPASPVTIHVAHSSFKQSDKFFGREKVDLIRPQPSEDGPGNSQHIVIMSPAGVTEFLAKFKLPGRRPFYDLRAGFVFFDEFHTYKGDKTKMTIPFKMLESISARNGSYTIAVGLSGSARADCAYWRPFIQHSFHDRTQLKNSSLDPSADRFKIAGMRTISDFDDYETSWKYLVNNLNNTTLQGYEQLEELQGHRDYLFQFLKNFIPSMMLSRQRGDTFRGVAILKKSPIQLIRCDTEAGYIKGIFGDLISHVKMLVQHEYLIELSQWISRNREGDKPIKRAIAQRRLEFLSDGPRNRAGSVVPQLMLRSSTFPAVAQLVHENQSVSYGDVLGRNVITTATRISRILAPDKLDNERKMQALDVLKSSAWWQHRDLLYEQSPKVKEVERQIDTLINISVKDADDPSLANLGPPPSDGTNIRHLLLFTDYPLSAFLILMVLFPKYIDRNVVFLYVHSGVDVTSRRRYVDYVQRDCQKGDPVKILISTMSILGRGFNIFRASNVIITEVPRSWDMQNQAFGRVDRRGQVMDPNLIQLHDGFNLVEEVRRIRNENREQISRVGYNSDSYPLADLVLDKGDDGKADGEQDSKGTGDKEAQGSNLVTRFRDAASEAAARQAFPNLKFRRISTRGVDDLCGVFAVIGSIQRQFDQQDVPVPDFNDLLDAVYGAQDDFGVMVDRNFSPDQVFAGLREWARRNDVPIDFHLGYILRFGQGNSNEAILINSDNIEGRRKVVVWVYVHTDGDAGHFEAVERVN